jgi:hypothetical protein
MANTFQESRCLPNCPAPSRKLCHSDLDCPPGKDCEELLTTPIAGLNYSMGVDAYANYFRWCAP